MIQKIQSFCHQIKNEDNEFPHRIEDFASILVMIALLADVILQVITRYLFNSPLGWTEEIARYLLILLTFVGAPIAVRKNSNVSLDFLLTNAPPKVKNIFGLLSGITELVFCVFGIYLSWKMTIFSLNRYLVTVHISRSVIYGIITVCFVVMTLRGSLKIVQQLRIMFAEQKCRRN